MQILYFLHSTCMCILTVFYTFLMLSYPIAWRQEVYITVQKKKKKQTASLGYYNKTINK